MKLFVIWADKSPELVGLLSELKNSGHRVDYWLGYDDSEAHRFPGTIFHSYKDAILGIPAKEVDDASFPPPGADLLKKLSEAELTALTMMNRFFYKDKNIDERRHLYYQMIRYWHGVLLKYKPDQIIFSDVPHFVYDYMIYELARLMGIKTLMFLDTRIPGRLLYFDNDWMEGSADLKENLRLNAGKDFEVSDLAGDVADYYRKFADKNLTQLPPNIRYQKGKYSILRRVFPLDKIYSSIRDLSIFRKAPYYLHRFMSRDGKEVVRKLSKQISYLFMDNLKKEYSAVQSSVDFNKKFVYVPLHVQPECSTSPQGDIFVDQILMLEALSVSLPSGWRIYVKEHPIQWLRIGTDFSGYRYQGYYRKIADIRNVYLASMQTNSYDLINRSQAVVTVAGAAGWEAFLRLKPSIIFGYPWYKDCPGLLRANGAESCRVALQKVADGLKISRQDAVNYLKSLESATIRGYIAASAGQGSDLSKGDSMKNITKFILSKLS